MSVVCTDSIVSENFEIYLFIFFSIVKIDNYLGEYTFPCQTHIQQRDSGSFVWNLEAVTDWPAKLEEEVGCPIGDSFPLLNKEKKLMMNSYKCPEFNIKEELAALKKLVNPSFGGNLAMKIF